MASSQTQSDSMGSGKALPYSNFTKATISPPWAISAPNIHFSKSAFTASMRAPT